MPKHLVISTSGNPNSNSRRIGRVALAHLRKRKVDCDWIDISEMELPLCDADKCYGMPGSKKLSAAIKAADGILVAAPVYNYDVADSARREITKRYRCQCGSHPGGENAIEERQVGAQKYPRALQSRTGDKTICLPYSATK